MFQKFGFAPSNVSSNPSASVRSKMGVIRALLHFLLVLFAIQKLSQSSHLVREKLLSLGCREMVSMTAIWKAFKANLGLCDRVCG